MMSKTKFLSIIVIALVLLNTGMIIGIIMKLPDSPGFTPDKHPRHEGPKYLIIEKLHFDEEQVVRYEELIKDHRRQIREKEGQLMEAKSELYKLLQGEDHHLRDSLSDVIGNIQTQIEHIHFEHFNDIKHLCREDQMQYFDELTTELERLFAPPHMRVKKSGK